MMGAAQIVSAAPEKKPNLLVIHTDEQSFRTLSCYQKLLSPEQAFIWGKGNNSTTPNIDKLAEDGAICTSYYCSSPVSTPSRASMVTGLYPQVTGAPVNGMTMRDDLPTIGSILTENGYSTSYVGKWHLAGDEEKYGFGIEYNGGFTDNEFMMTAGHAPYFVKDKKTGKLKGVNQAAVAKLPKDEYIHLTDFFTEKALDIMARDKDKPFCLYISIPDPHTPDYARPPYHDMYKDLNPQMPYTMTPEVANNRPSWGKGGEKDKNEANVFKAEPLKQYFGMVKHIDDCVGQMVDYLKKNDLYDNTIIIFTSDHGDMFYEHNRMNKGVPYEASARIPFVISYPKAIPAGKVINKAHVNTDMTPTLLGLMGVKTNAKFHGEDKSADFVSKSKTVDGDCLVHFADCGGFWVSVADDRYKLVVTKGEKPWLIDLEKDPYEIKNYFNDPKYAKIAKRMIAQLKKDLVEYKSPALEKKINLIWE